MKGFSSYYTTLKALPVVSRNAEKSFFQKKDVYLKIYHLQQMLYDFISIGQFTKLHIVGLNHYAKFRHCQIHVNEAGKWKTNITKLYGHPFWRLPKCIMNLFVVAALCNCGSDCERWLFFIIIPCFTENSLKISLNRSYLDFFRFSGCIPFCTVNHAGQARNLICSQN